jgi:LmbE family N-acetylglucosaminyl deacetylase
MLHEPVPLPRRGHGTFRGPIAPGYTRPAMTHVFVAPHPDDVALSCGGLIASLRELGQNVTILTLYSGSGNAEQLTPYQREALGFGSKAVWPVSEAFNRAHLQADYPGDAAAAPWQATREGLDATQGEADAAAKRFWQRSSWYRRARIHNESLAGQPVIDDMATQGSVLTSERTDAAAAGDTMATRRLEDERFAAFAEVSVVWLDLPDAVFRGYVGDDQLLGAPRADDPAPVDLLRREIARLEPSRIYLPLGIGGHVDHQLARDAGIALMHDAQAWVMPGPDYAEQTVFYEDFPYAWWEDFGRLGDLPPDSLAGLPEGVSLTADFADVGDVLERKIQGILLYESQIERLFDDRQAAAAAVRAYAARVADIGSVASGAAERYWVTTPA